MKRCLRCGAPFTSTLWHCPQCGWKATTRDGIPLFAPELEQTDGGFDPERFRFLASVEANSFWFTARNRLITWALSRYFPHASNLLEIGCGTGFVLKEIVRQNPDLDVYGSEIFSQGLHYSAKRAPSANLMQMDARAIPYVNEFDVIGAFDVIEHIDDDENVLRQMYAACSPKGGCIITVPQHRWLWSGQDERAHHKRRYTRVELIEKTQAAGFKAVYVTSFVSLLLPLMVISRRSGSHTSTDTTSSELTMRPAVNRVLSWAMGAEYVLLRAGIRFPVGGSLLLVAIKNL